MTNPNSADILEKIKTVLSDVDTSMEDRDKLAMAHGYWEAGRLATEYKESTGMSLKDIARETQTPPWAMQKYALFYRSFPNGYPKKYGNRVLGWSLIYAVLRVHNAKAREFYLKEACRYGWDKYELTRRINRDYYGAVTDAAASRGNGALKVRKQRLYTYAAQVLKVVDADTFDLEIDVGFKSKQEHRVRLSGIDAPEMGTAAGRKAKRFVETEFGRCVVKASKAKGIRAPRPLVVVKTYKTGKYGRYMVDLHYLAGATDPEAIVEKGKWLNQVLVDKGLARKV